MKILVCIKQVADPEMPVRVVERGSVYVEREIEGGLRAALELDLPAVLTVQTGINKPRYPTLSNLLRAKKQKALL